MVKDSISSSLLSKRYNHRGYNSEIAGTQREKQENKHIIALTKRLTVNDFYDRENRVRLELILQQSLDTISYENQVSNIKNTETYHQTAEIRKDL